MKRCQFVSILGDFYHDFRSLLIVFGLTVTTFANSGSAPVFVAPPHASSARLTAPALAGPDCWSANHHCTFVPVVTAAHLATDPRDRGYSLNLYKQTYLASSPLINWTGSSNSCDPGDTNVDFRNAVLRRVNYFREMAGVPKVIGMNSLYNQQTQAAALMMSVNNTLNHNPPTTWQCFSAVGHTGAGSSNLAWGVNGPDAITLYMDDGGLASLGHRRWVLYPQTQQMGTGDVPTNGTNRPTNALKSWDDNMWGARPATRNEFVAWPPAAYVPYQVVFAYWSFAYPGAVFSNASVRVTNNGADVGITQYAQENGYGENTLVWKINNINGSWPRPSGDTIYQVTISGVSINGQIRSFSYNVIVFDPGV